MQADGALLPRQRRAAGERHLPHPPFPSRRWTERCSRSSTSAWLPEFAGTVTILDALRRRAPVGMAAPARRQDARHRSASNDCRATPILALLERGARSEPDQPARHRRAAVGRRRGRNRSLRRRRLQRRSRQQRRQRRHQPREGLRRAAVLPVRSGPRRCADFGNLGVGLSVGDRQPQGPRCPPRPAPAVDRPGAVPDRRAEHVLPVPGAGDRHDRRDDGVHARAGDAPQPSALLLLRLVRPAGRVPVAASRACRRGTPPRS